MTQPSRLTSERTMRGHNLKIGSTQAWGEREALEAWRRPCPFGNKSLSPTGCPHDQPGGFLPLWDSFSAGWDRPHLGHLTSQGDLKWQCSSNSNKFHALQRCANSTKETRARKVREKNWGGSALHPDDTKRRHEVPRKSPHAMSRLDHHICWRLTFHCVYHGTHPLEGLVYHVSHVLLRCHVLLVNVSRAV